MKPIYSITEYSPEIKPLMRVSYLPVQKLQYIADMDFWISSRHDICRAEGYGSPVTNWPPNTHNERHYNTLIKEFLKLIVLNFIREGYIRWLRNQ